MRATLRDLLVSDAGLTALVPAERWYAQGAVIDTPVKPFVVLQWITPVASNARGAFAHQLRITVHDERGSYTRIDKILGGPYRSGGIWPILDAVENVEGPDGRITECTWLGNGGDDVDIDYKTNARFGSWQIIGRTTS